jgi:hypothetical protein
LIVRNTKRIVSACLLLASTFGARVAHATHPDYEGERGLELQLMAGVGGATTHHEGVFLPTQELPRPEDREPTDSFGASGGFALSAGYRFTPFLSAGLTGSYQLLSEANLYPNAEAGLGPVDTIRSFQVGAYARVYPMTFFSGARANPRVFFDTWTDRRRFDPWLSLGVSFAQFSRSRDYTDVSFLGSYTHWTTSYLGVPIGVGVDYRLIPALAVGLTFSVTPLVAGGTSKVRSIHESRPGVDQTTTTEASYAPGADSNASYFVGLGVRYTFTL